MVEQTATDDAIVRLKDQVKTAEAERDEARAQAKKLHDDAAAAVAARVASDEAALKNGVTAAQTKLDALENRYVEALKSEDPVAAAKINREMAEATVELDNFRRREANLQRWKERQTAELAAQAKREQEGGHQDHQRVEYDPATQAWLDRHGIDGQKTTSPEFLRAQAGHFDAESRGLKAGTPEYFAHLDAYVGGGAAPTATSPYSSAADTVEVDLNARPQGDPPPRQEQQRDNYSPALPPTRTAPTITQHDNRVVNGRVRLTPGEVEAARISNPDLYRKDPDAALREYAQNKALLIQEQRL